MMCPHPTASTVAERYDNSLIYAKNGHLPPEAPRPLPTSHWPQENIALLERFREWLVGGGTSERTTDLFYLPAAGHALGLNLKPHAQINLEGDLERVLAYLQAKGISQAWLKLNRNGLEMFRRFLRMERGLGEVRKTKPFNVAEHTKGLPQWLVSELERFQRVQQRNWRMARLEQNICRYWSTHLRVWRFLCEQRNVLKFEDLKRQHILDYADHRLYLGYAVAGVNIELLSLHSFLVFLQDEGYAIPQSLLRISCLKQPDALPKYIPDEQIKLLRDDFEGRVAQASLSDRRRDALLDRAMFYLLWQCGLRSGEVEELRLEDLDLGVRKITIRDGKGRKDRTVYVTSNTVHAVQEYLAVRGVGSGDHVFLYRNAPLKDCMVHRRISAAGERTGVKVYPHRLRHTTATQLLNAGCRITSIQKFLGHKRLNSTMIYARAHDQTVSDDYFAAMERIEQRLEIKPISQPEPESSVVNEQPITKEPGNRMVFWLERLAVPELSREERWEIAQNLKQALSISYASLLSPPMVDAG
jgi:site-specific recombinase XerD